MADHATERLLALDPTLTEHPPAPGSDRYRLIQEKIMTATQAHDPTTRETADRPAPIRRPRLTQYAAAAVVLLLAAGVLIVGSPTTRAAADVVRDAAENLDAVDSLRATLVQTYPNGEIWTFEGEFVGPDGRQVGTQRAPDGTVLSTWELVVVGDTAWMITDDAVHSETLRPDEALAPFAIASAAVITAAVEGGTVEDLGQETVGGQEAARYRIDLGDGSTAALAALAPGQLSWFSLEDPTRVAAIDVWVADDIVRRIEVAFAEGHFMHTSTAEFFDFGAPMTISAPRAQPGEPGS